MKSKILFVVLLSLAGLVSCGEPDTVWVEREAADCCNPWDGIVGDDLALKVNAFLNSNGVDVLQVELKDMGRQVFCVHCCGCPTGVIVEAKVPFNQLGRAEELGFFEE